MSRHLPINLWVDGCECLVVGGGRVALRKALSLVACGARVTVVSPRLCPELEGLDGVHLIQAEFGDDHVAGMTLVFAATSDADVNRRVAQAARRGGALVNVVDTPAECDFIVPSTLTRGDLTISVCSGGAAPALSRRIREGLEAQFPEAHGDFVALLGKLRREVLDRVPDVHRRRDVLRRLADESTWALFRDEGPDAVRGLAERLIAR